MDLALFSERDAFETQVAVFTFAFDVGVVEEKVVNEAAVVTVHRLKLDGMSAEADSLGLLADFLQHAVFTHGAEVFDVHSDAGSVGITADENSINEVLDIFKDCTTLADQGIWLLGVDLQSVPFGSVLLLNTHDESKIAKEGIKDLAGLVEGGHEGGASSDK